MILVALSDIHSATASLALIASDLDRADAVILSGDITDFGGPDELAAVVDKIEEFGRPVFGVCGNCDQPQAAAKLAALSNGIERKAVIINGLPVVGIGGSLPCPVKTPNEFSEAHFASVLSQEPFASLAPRSFVFVSHQPPLDTLVDKASKGGHVGSGSVRRFVESKQPLLCITGHIHEAKGLDMLGETRIVNPGPFKSGNYAVIEIAGTTVQDISLRSV